MENGRGGNGDIEKSLYSPLPSQKDAVYVARLTAVRKRLVVLPGGGSSSSSGGADTVLEQTLESPPSVPSALLRTLAPAAEIARLQARQWGGRRACRCMLL